LPSTTMVVIGARVVVVVGPAVAVVVVAKPETANVAPAVKLWYATANSTSPGVLIGYSLLQAVEAVSAEAPNPTAREFSRAIVEARLGRSVSDSLNGIVERTNSADFDWAVMAIDIQREVGGNLSEVLETVADTMRARNRLKGEIMALTAEGRISAIVLGSLPFGLFAFLWFSNREYLLPLVESEFGLMAIGVGMLLMTAGILWLKKIVNIEI